MDVQTAREGLKGGLHREEDDFYKWSEAAPLLESKTSES